MFASLYVVQPLLPLIVRRFEVSVSEATLTLSVTIIGLIIGLIILGFLSDRNGRVAFMKYSLVGAVIPFFLIPFLDSFYPIVLLRFLQGFALAGLPAAALAYINEEINRLHIGIATALYISSNALGGMAGRVVAGYLAERFTLETVFYSFVVQELSSSLSSSCYCLTLVSLKPVPFLSKKIWKEYFSTLKIRVS